MSVGLPIELDFSEAMSLPESKSYELRVQPSNASSFTQAGSVISISLPMTDRSFYQTNTMYLTGRVTVTCAGVANTDTLFLPGCGFYACFANQTWRTNAGQTLENITQLGSLANMLLSVGLGSAERIPVANLMGTSDDEVKFFSNLGFEFNRTNAPGRQTVLDFAIPMIGIMNASKYLPAYGTELVLELTIAPSSQWGIPGTATSNITAFTFSNVELVTEVLELGQAGMSQISQKYGNAINFKTQSYAFGASSIPASTAGTVDIPFQARCLSMKQLFVAFSPANVAEGVGYGTVNPNASSICVNINGTQYPSTAVRCNRPAEAFAQLQKCFGALYSADKVGNISIQGWRAASTAYVTGVYGAYNATREEASYKESPNRWFFALDLESLSNHKELMYNGVNTSSGSNMIRVEIGTALSAHVHSVYMFSCHDVIINFDLQNGIVSAIQ